MQRGRGAVGQVHGVRPGRHVDVGRRPYALGLDSVDSLEMAIAVETEFGVAITEDDLAAFRSINTVLDFIEERTSTTV